MFSKHDDPAICGLDESGRGPLAGPLVAAIVAFPPDYRFREQFRKHTLRDSKKLTRLSRERLLPQITEHALIAETIVISVEEINAYGIGWANRTAFERLIMQVDAIQYIVDGNLKFSNLGKRANKVKSIVRADENHDMVSAASILAKTHRDQIMRDLAVEYPEYGWENNKGYGTATHIAALRKYGITPYHRLQFVTTALADQPSLPGLGE